MLKVVSFDVGGTLMDSCYANYVWNEAIPQLYATKRDISFEEARNYVLREYDRIGSNDIRWYFPEYWFKHFNLDEDPIKIFKMHVDKVRFYPEVPSVLENLSQKCDLIIISGTPRDTIEIAMEKVSHYFKHVFSSVSDRRELRKTPQFYETICKFLRIKPQAMMHVGNEWYSDFVAPRRIGIKSFYLDRTGEKGGKFVVKDLGELEGHLTSL